MWGPTLIFALIGSAVLKFVGYKQTNKTSLFKEEVNELFTVYTFSAPVHYSLHLQYTCTVYTFSTPVHYSLHFHYTCTLQSTPSVHLYTTVYTFSTPVHYSVQLNLERSVHIHCWIKYQKKNCARSRKKYIRILKIRLKPRILSKIASVSLTNQRPRCCNTSKSTWSFIVYNLW